MGNLCVSETVISVGRYLLNAIIEFPELLWEYRWGNN